MFLVTASNVADASVWEVRSDLPDNLGSEANHTAHDVPGVETFVAFESLIKIYQKMELYKHE